MIELNKKHLFKNACIGFLTLVLHLQICSYSISSSYAETKRAVIFGGNCEEPGLFDAFTRGNFKGGNAFRSTFANLSRSLKSNNWEVKPLYADKLGRCTLPATSESCKGFFKSKSCCPEDVDPEHWNSSYIAKALDLNFSTDIPFANKKNLFDELEKAANELTENDQFLLVIETHGSLNKETKTHEICLAERKTMATNDVDFKLKLSKIRRKGIKIGIIDDSCYGGASVKDLQEFGCVLTSQNASSPTQVFLASDVGNEFKKVEFSSSNEFEKYIATKPKYTLGGASSALLKILNSKQEDIDQILLNKNKNVTFEELFLLSQVNDQLKLNLINFPEISGFMEPYETAKITLLTDGDMSKELIDQLLSGGGTPIEKFPDWIRSMMSFADKKYFSETNDFFENDARDRLLAYKNSFRFRNLYEDEIEKNKALEYPRLNRQFDITA